MPLWTKDAPPVYLKDTLGNKIAKQTLKGWEHPTTGEVLVAIGGLSTLQAGAEVTFIRFAATSYETGDPISVEVGFSEPVSVAAGASIVITFTGAAGNITLYAAAQTNSSVITFDKESDNTTPETLPLSVAASGTLTGDGVNVSNGDTVTIGAKVYTFQNTLTNVDGNVKIAGTAAGSLTNLFRAINASGGTPGTDYALATTAHPTVTATNPTATTVVVTAITKGAGGNSIASTEASTHLSWGGATLSGGVTNTGNLSVGAQTIGGSATDVLDSVAATGSLTLTANPANDETVVIDGKTYTFKTTLTNTNGFVKIGANEEQSLENLIAAINLDEGAGTKYAAATTLHSTVSAADGGSKIMTVTAKAAGTGGNSLATTETLGNGSWGGATLSGGSVQAASLVVSGGIASAVTAIAVTES